MEEERKESPEAVGGIVALDTTVVSEITKAEIDVQISTAKKYPRSLQAFNERALSMATLDEDTAASCIYRRPVGKEGGRVKYAEGKSVRLAEIVGVSYGNLRVGAFLVEQTDRWVKARGIAHDLESNFACSCEVVESTVDKYGNPYSERMRIVVAKAALAKARRDATFQVVPGAICKGIETAARMTAIGTVATLEARRASVMDWLGKLGVKMDRVFGALGIKGPDDIDIEVLTTITGIRTALKDGDVTIDEAFPAEPGKNDIAEPKAKKKDAPAPEAPPAPPAKQEATAPKDTHKTLPPSADPSLPPEPDGPAKKETPAAGGNGNATAKFMLVLKALPVRLNSKWANIYDKYCYDRQITRLDQLTDKNYAELLPKIQNVFISGGTR